LNFANIRFTSIRKCGNCYHFISCQVPCFPYLPVKFLFIALHTPHICMQVRYVHYSARHTKCHISSGYHVTQVLQMKLYDSQRFVCTPSKSCRLHFHTKLFAESPVAVSPYYSQNKENVTSFPVLITPIVSTWRRQTTRNKRETVSQLIICTDSHFRSGLEKLTVTMLVKTFLAFYGT